MPKMANGLRYWTADEVAECLSYDEHLPPDYKGNLGSKLWGFLNDAKNPTPQGGDGSEGTVEEPSGRLDENNDDKAPHWWGKLTEVEQAAINAAYEEDGFNEERRQTDGPRK